MTIERIRQTARALKERYDVMNTAVSLQENAHLTYYRQALEKLDHIFNDNPEKDLRLTLTNSLQHFLFENWALINGTFLSYTALPKEEMTNLFITIAQWVAEEKNQYLRKNECLLHPLKLMMPTISVESIRKDYDELGPDSDISTVLQTHILGNGGLYLLPVKLVTEIELSTQSTKLCNPYYDYASHPEQAAYLNSEEYLRLIGHSTLTQAVLDTKQDYDLWTNDSSNFLGQLTLLCQQLSFNDVSGIGTEKSAAGGAYSAIIYFMEYFNKLDDGEKEKIPNPLKQKINNLLGLITDPKKNDDATTRMETCVFMHRIDIINAMSNHESILSQISLSSLKKQPLIEEAKTHFQTAKNNLNTALISNDYVTGYDRLCFNFQLLTALKVPLNVSSLADLDFIKNLNTTEMTYACQHTDLPHQIIKQLTTIENLVIFFMELPAENRTTFLNETVVALVQQLIISPDDLRVLLVNLSAEQRLIIWSALHDQLRTTITKAREFSYWLENLDSESRTEVYAIMKNTLPDMITSNSDFTKMFRYLTPEQRTEVYEAMKNRLPRRMQSLLNKLFDSLNTIQSAEQFRYLLQYLAEEQRTIIFGALQKRLPNLIHSANDFNTILEYLTQEQRTTLYHATRDHLPQLIDGVIQGCFGMLINSPDARESAARFNGILQYLSLEQRSDIYNIIKIKLPAFIRACSATPNIQKQGEGLSQVLEYLSPEQCLDVCKSIKKQLGELIKSAGDFDAILQLISSDQRTNIYAVMKNKLPSIIKNTHDYDIAKQLLSSEQQTDLSHLITLNNLKQIFSDDTAKTFNRVFISSNNEDIKSHVDRLIKQTTQRRANPIYFFSNKQSISQLIDILSSLEASWLGKLNTALALTEPASADQQGYKAILEQYIATSTTQGASLQK